MNLNKYSPGLHKLVHHLDHLKAIQDDHIVAPLHVSVFPNNWCNLNCPYCCFRNQARNIKELSIDDFKHAVDVLTYYGTKAMEFSGGGEPLLWKPLSDAVLYAHSKGLKLSLVTNGLLLTDIPKSTLEKFTWVRVSVQSVEYAKKIKLDWIPCNVKVSMSYIVYDEKSRQHLKKLHEFAKEKNIVIRIAPIRPCDDIWAKEIVKEANDFGYPFVAFNKESGAPLGCYMAWIRAAIDWNGRFIPCPSIELSPESEGRIPYEFGVCDIKDLEEWLINTPVSDLGYRCSFCNCGKDENDLVYNILKEVDDVDFV